MRKSVFLPFCLIGSCILCVLFLCRPAGAAGSVLVIDYPEYWPFFTRQENGEMGGFFYDIVTEALGRMGMTARWRAFPWNRCQANVKNGDSEAMITVPTPERLEYAATHEAPFYRKELAVFTYKGHPSLRYIKDIQTFDDIKQGGLVVVTYAGNGWNERNIRSRGIKVYETPIIPSVWPMLAHRRGDIVIEWPVAAWADIRKAGVVGEVVQTDVRFDPMPFHLMVGRESGQARILAEFNRVVLEMRGEGRISEIVEQYTHPE